MRTTLSCTASLPDAAVTIQVCREKFSGGSACQTFLSPVPRPRADYRKRQTIRTGLGGPGRLAGMASAHRNIDPEAIRQVGSQTPVASNLSADQLELPAFGFAFEASSKLLEKLTGAHSFSASPAESGSLLIGTRRHAVAASQLERDNHGTRMSSLHAALFLAQHLAVLLGQSIAIQNCPGAGRYCGTEAAVKAVAGDPAMVLVGQQLQPVTLW